MTAISSSEVVKDLLTKFREQCEQVVPGLSVEAAEACAEEVSWQAAAIVFETAVTRGSERAGYQGPARPCACGGKAKFVEYRGHWVRSLYGEVWVRRAYYYCPECKTGICPWDATQGLGAMSFTPGAKQRIAQLCARMPYREAAEEITSWTGRTLAESTLEAVTGAVGARLRAEEDARTEGWFEQGKIPPAAPLAPRVVERA